MNTLLEYAQKSFPNHDTRIVERGAETRVELATHTVVAHVVGTPQAERVASTMRDAVGADRVTTVMVRPVEPTVTPTAREDTDGTIDLPNRRSGAGVALGATIGAAVGFVVGLAVGSVGTAVILAFFGAAAFGAVGFIISSARHAGQRAVSQPQAPGRNVAIVAAFVDDEASATNLARAISADDDEYDVRIVSTDGGWHSPNN